MTNELRLRFLTPLRPTVYQNVYHVRHVDHCIYKLTIVYLETQLQHLCDVVWCRRLDLTDGAAYRVGG